MVARFGVQADCRRWGGLGGDAAAVIARHRRFEAAYPSIAPRILAVLRLDVPGCAEGLMEVAERLVAPRVSDWRKRVPMPCE